METTQTPTGHYLEIACDESGWEGSNLSKANSDVIAYASVRLDVDAAAECIATLRGSSRHDGHEYKASHLLRTKDETAIAGFLGPSSPVHGNARVHLTHKSCFVLGRVLDMFIGGSADASSLGVRPDRRLTTMAARLCRAGPDIFGRDLWLPFLTAANVVLHADRARRVSAPVDAFFAQVEVLRSLDRDTWVTGILDELHDQRSDAYSARAELLDVRALQPVLEPLIPALARAVLHWSRGLHPVAIVHDEQSALTERRIRRLEQTLAAPPLEMIKLPEHGRFIRFRQVDSRTDPRVQVADLLAGVARKVATDELLGQGNPVLTTLLEPYVDPDSRWCVPVSA